MLPLGDWLATEQAWLRGSTVDRERIGHVLTVGHVLNFFGVRGLDRVAKLRHDRDSQPPTRRLIQLSCRDRGVNPRAKESLRRMDVSEPRESTLIHECDLDRRARLQSRCETRTIEGCVERIGTVTGAELGLQIP